jgi:hypothetical protein
MSGAASSQNAADQPSVASCNGSGVNPYNTMPQASQVPAASVKGSEVMGDSERRDMASSWSEWVPASL